MKIAQCQMFLLSSILLVLKDSCTLHLCCVTLHCVARGGGESKDAEMARGGWPAAASEDAFVLKRENGGVLPNRLID